MQEAAIQCHEAGRSDPPGQASTPIATSLNSNIPSPGGPGGRDQLNTRHNSYDVAFQGFFAEAAMASPLTQQSYQDGSNLTFMGSMLPPMSYHPHQAAYCMHAFGQPYDLAMSPPVAAIVGQPVPMANHPYYIGQTQVPPFYHGGYVSHPHNQPGIHGHSNVVYYPNQTFMDHAHASLFYPEGGQYPHHPCMASANVLPRSYMAGVSQNNACTSHQYGLGSPNRDDPSSKQNAVRGPPRKPRQSGHALWIGNLPPQTDLMALVKHICKKTLGMESLFLISKSNCAFANYKDEAACSAAQQKLHDSKFQSVRLVSHLRRNTIEGTSGTIAPTCPAPGAASRTRTDEPGTENKISTGADGNGTTSPAAQSRQDVRIRSGTDKFFILKSLTTEDLDLSVRTGIWATQPHNEESLNRAFQSVNNVYLIFSANKSGEYFGYARMMSEMNEDPAAAVEFAPAVMTASEVDVPKAIPTDASDFAPRGNIIDDSARGTLFWEAERDGVELGSDMERKEGPEAWRKSFQLEWLSTTRLPFCRARGLRNPWNSNREVKIARDGTEVEPSVGRRLVGLF